MQRGGAVVPRLREERGIAGIFECSHVNLRVGLGLVMGTILICLLDKYRHIAMDILVCSPCPGRICTRMRCIAGTSPCLEQQGRHDRWPQ